MVYDFALPDARACGGAARHGASIAGPAERPLRGPRRARGEHRAAARRGQDSAPRYPRRVAAAVGGGGRDARGDRDGRARPARRCTPSMSRAPPRVDEIRAARGRRSAGLRRDVPALPGARRVALRAARRGVRSDSSSRRRCARRPTATRCGGRSPTARSTSSRPTTCPIGWRSRSDWRPAIRPHQQRRPGHRDAAERRLQRGRRSAGGSASSAWSTCCRPRPRASSG